MIQVLFFLTLNFQKNQSAFFIKFETNSVRIRPRQQQTILVHNIFLIFSPNASVEYRRLTSALIYYGTYYSQMCFIYWRVSLSDLFSLSRRNIRTSREKNKEQEIHFPNWKKQREIVCFTLLNAIQQPNLIKVARKMVRFNSWLFVKSKSVI